MIDDREIWACPNTLLRLHGTGAQEVAAGRAAELLAAGQVDGHRTFMLILDRIRQLEATKTDQRLQ